MMIAQASGDGKKQALLLGLSRGNVERLMKNQPIRLRRETHGEGIPEGWEIIILFGETEQAICDDLEKAGMIGPWTKATVDPRLNEERK